MRKLFLLLLILMFLTLVCYNCTTTWRLPFYLEVEKDPYIFDHPSLKLTSGIELGSLPMKVNFGRIKTSQSQIEFYGVVYYDDSVRLSGVGIYTALSPLTSGLTLMPVAATDSNGTFQFKVESGMFDILVFTYPGMECKIFRVMSLHH